MSSGAPSCMDEEFLAMLGIPAAVCGMDDAPDKEHSDDNPNPSVAVAPLESARPRARRNRQKEELLRLREDATRLEGELAALKKRRMVQAEDKARSASPRARRCDMASVWEKIATRQHKERQRVEVENAKLRERLETQSRIAQDLRRLMEKQSKIAAPIEALPEFPDENKPQHIRLHESPDAPIFLQLLQSLETAPANVDAVFCSTILNSVVAPYHATQLKLEDEAGIAVEVVAKRVFPFDLHEFSTTMWRFMLREGEQRYSLRLVEVDTDDENVVARAVEGRLPCEGMVVDVKGKHVIKRVYDGSRFILVWQAILEAKDCSSCPPTTVELHEHGWATLQPLATANTIEAKMRRVVCPVTSSQPSERDWKVYSLIELINNFHHAQANHAQQKVENILLESALQRHATTSPIGDEGGAAL